MHTHTHAHKSLLHAPSPPACPALQKIGQLAWRHPSTLVPPLVVLLTLLGLGLWAVLASASAEERHRYDSAFKVRLLLCGSGSGLVESCCQPRTAHAFSQLQCR